jgi:alcohol dehydrogenase (cytochrome c)
MTRILTIPLALAALLTTPAHAQGVAPGDWPSYNRTLTGERTSPLAQITGKNVDSLRAVCTYDTGLTTSFQTGPIVVAGIMYFTTEFDTFAIDAATCAERWRTTLDYERAGPLRVNRGAAFLDGRLFRGLQDGRLIALDAGTGDLLWEVQIGIIEKGETIPAAPVAWDGKVFGGNAGGDNYGVKGRVYAFDAETGAPVWETFLVPKEQNVGALTVVDSPISNDATDGYASAGDPTTWNVEEGEPITGGASWTSYTLDPGANDGRGLLYIPTANPAPDFISSLRGGANLMTNSITVLDAQTGEYVRHHLMVPEDFHDWDASAAPAVVTTADGTRTVLAGAKDGNLHAFEDVDAASGNANVEGQLEAAPGGGEPASVVPSNKRYTRAVTSMLNVDAPLTPDGTYFCPGALGGVQWNGPAYAPATNMVYVGAVDWCTTVFVKDAEEARSLSLGQPWSGNQPQEEDDIFGQQDPIERGRGWLSALDADTGTVAWVWQASTPLIAGVTPTAGGLVMTGDLNGDLHVFDAVNGARLTSYAVGGPIGGGVITYTDDGTAEGRQLIAVTSGMNSPVWDWKGGPARITVLGLGD